MSLVYEEIAKHNAMSEENKHNAAIEHMAELETKRVAEEEARLNSMQGAWEQLRLKRKPKVLNGLLPVQSQ